MLKVCVYQIRDEFVLVERMTYNPLYPLFIIVDKKNISDAYCELGYIGYVTPIGGNQYRFTGA
jgi:hypothetical protein